MNVNTDVFLVGTRVSLKGSSHSRGTVVGFSTIGHIKNNGNIVEWDDGTLSNISSPYLFPLPIEDEYKKTLQIIKEKLTNATSLVREAEQLSWSIGADMSTMQESDGFRDAIYDVGFTKDNDGWQSSAC